MGKKLPKITCEEVTFDEGIKIAKTLLDILEENKGAMSLSANQIGINKRVCVIKVKKPIILLNPKILGAFGTDIDKERCLSFPKKPILVKRYCNILVHATNHSKALQFGHQSQTSRLECIYVQNAIDHLDGITILDREVEK